MLPSSTTTLSSAAHSAQNHVDSTHAGAYSPYFNTSPRIATIQPNWLAKPIRLNRIETLTERLYPDPRTETLRLLVRRYPWPTCITVGTPFAINANPEHYVRHFATRVCGIHDEWSYIELVPYSPIGDLSISQFPIYILPIETKYTDFRLELDDREWAYSRFQVTPGSFSHLLFQLALESGPVYSSESPPTLLPQHSFLRSLFSHIGHFFACYS